MHSPKSKRSTHSRQRTTRGKGLHPQNVTTDSIDRNENQPDKLRKKDNRLYCDGPFGPEYLLYCEGLNRPFFRGVLHLICTIVLLYYSIWHFYSIAGESCIHGKFVGIVYILSNIFCYGISSLYHVGGGWYWSLEIEIILQKLDHCGIAILSAGSLLPMATLLLDEGRIGNILQCFLVFLCLLTFFKIFQNKPSVLRQLSVAGAFVPFLPFLIFRFNSFELTALLCGCALNFIAVYFFVHQIPNQGTICQNWFGYHEVFHVFIVSAGLCAYIMNYSIVYRKCLPY